MKANSGENWPDFPYSGMMHRRQTYQAEAARYALAKQARAGRSNTSYPNYWRTRLGLKLTHIGLALMGRLEQTTAHDLLAQIQSRS